MKQAQYLNKILSINALQAFYRKDGRWFHSLFKFPGVLFDANGYVLFENQNAYLEEPKLQKGMRLHVKDGIKSLSSYTKFSKNQIELIIGFDATSFLYGNNEESPIRVKREIELILRNKNFVEKLKNLYSNTCQICDETIMLSINRWYSEIHHIIPLGQPYNGKDSLNNMICVCPNCHVKLDFNTIELGERFLSKIRHEISSDSISHHNSIYRNLNINL